MAILATALIDVNAISLVRTPDEQEFEWQQAVKRFRQQITALNERISTYNMGVPAEQFQKPILDTDREITRLTSQTLSDKL